MSLTERDLASASQTNSFRLFTTQSNILENVQSAKYLCMSITDNMDWVHMSQKFLPKTTKTLGFLRRNLAFVPRSTKEVAYKTLVRP